MRFISTFFLCVLYIGLIAQDYPSLIEQHANVYEIQKKFKEEWNGKAYERGKGWKQFQRWFNFWEPRLAPSGNFVDQSIPYKEILKYKDSNLNGKSVIGNWSSVGPAVIPQGGGGVGRLNCITFHPAIPSSIWVGAAAGGLWKSENSGTGWSTNTDMLASLGMSDMVVDPVDNNIMYLATGDVDASDAYSIGVLKSTDGGQTWNTTGLNWTVQQQLIISKLAISTTDHNIIYAATQNGFYRSNDGAFSWQKLKTGNFRDIELKPDDGNTLYLASQTGVFKSTNGGNTFINLNTGIDGSSVYRLTIAVTPANPDYLYILACATDYSFLGLWLSENAGSSFSQKSSSPNILTWNANGNGSGGQGWYDLALAVSPTNSSIVFVGGINVWKSTNKGSTWNCVGHWAGQNGVPYVHADIHDIKYSPYNSSTVFVCTDGGLFKSTNNGSTWTDLSAGLAITQIYRIGVDPNDDSKFLAGNQDNGTNRYLNGAWERVLGGDGMDCMTRGNTMFGSLYYGDLYRSTDGGNNFSGISSQITNSESGAWITPLAWHPINLQTIFAGYNNVWKSTNSGISWIKISDFPVIEDADKVNVLSIAPSDANYIYIAKGTLIHRTTNGGTGLNWTNITNNIPSLSITSISIDPNNPDRVWITFSGYTAGSKVYFTSDGGATWSNISGSLPNIPINCSVYQTATNDAIYIGTDMGVFYKNNDMADWMLFNGGLPFVIVNDLEIIYSSGLLRAATYGRGVWETPLFDYPNRVPVVDFNSDKKAACKGSIINFSDSTLFDPISWQWEFDGGIPSVSSDQNPTVFYDTPGVYPVTLTAANSNGSSSTIKSNYITIRTNSVPLIEDFEQYESSYNRFNIIKNLKSDVFISADDPVNLTHFIVLAGGSSYIDYSVPVGENAFQINPNYYSSASLCVDAKDVQTLMLQFDYKQLYETQNAFTNFRITVNGNQIAGIFHPNGATTAWSTMNIDLSSYAGTEFELSFEANNRSIYNHLIQGRGNATLIDNINITEVNKFDQLDYNSENVVLAPNPSSHDFSLNFKKSSDNREVKVVNAIGEIMYISLCNDLINQIFKSAGWKAGIYYVFVTENKKISVLKFVKL